MNFSKAGGDEPTLLCFDDARTLFHEFGHALHGLLSDVTYPMISCTSVLDRLGRAAVAALRALARAAGNPAPLRAPLPHRRADPGGADAAAHRGAHLQPGLRHGRIRRLRAGRSRFPFAGGARGLRRQRLRETRRSPASACRTRSSCATGRRISPTCSPAAATPRPITATCGRRCSTMLNGEVDAAVREYRMAVGLAPKSARAHAGLAAALAALHQDRVGGGADPPEHPDGSDQPRALSEALGPV